jgi:multidrug efflux system outer membrane protein
VGSDDLRAVIAQTVTLSSSRTALLRVQSERRVQRVNLHLALGGSFEAAPAVPREPAAEGGEAVRTASGAQPK